jgi:FkbM family methyltransferase
MTRVIRHVAETIAYGLAPRLTTAFKYERYLRRSEAEPELRLLSSLCDASEVSLDIGANRGIYCFHMAKFSSKVVAFEPNPVIFKLLARRMPRSVEVRNHALSDVSGTAILRVPTYRGCATIEPANELYGLGPVSTQQVDARRLDDLSLPGPIGFIKIDVEGHELAVLRGGQSSLQRYRPRLLIEIEERHRPGSLEEVRRLLNSLGYKGYFLYRNDMYTVNEFDVGAHQSITSASHPIPSRWNYVNNFIFTAGDNGENRMRRIRSRFV